MYKGWIILPEEDPDLKAEIISKCNLKLGDKDTDGSYNVEMTDTDLAVLDGYWGEAYWGLDHIKE